MIKLPIYSWTTLRFFSKKVVEYQIHLLIASSKNCGNTFSTNKKKFRTKSPTYNMYF